MSSYVASRMLKPPWFRISPLRRGRGERRRVVIGFDSEQDTTDATPMLYQFNDHGEAIDSDLRVVPPDPAQRLAVFMGYVDELRDKHTEYIIYGFNLQYEFTQIMGGLPTCTRDDCESYGQPLGAHDEITMHYHLPRPGEKHVTYRIDLINKSRYFATITHTGTKRRIRFLDARAFFVTSLDGAADMLDLPRKLYIASKKFTRADLTNPMFLDYARHDAYLTRRLGEVIVDMHETYDVPTTITAPHFAASVFRHAFLESDIPTVDEGIEQAGLWAYHGGKNGYYLDGPKHLSNVYAYDITSAYPEAMRQLPDPTQAVWTFAQEYRPGVHALWCVSGEYRSCRYRGLMAHENRFLDTGTITDQWVTSYELDAAVERGEIDISRCYGHVMEGPEGGPLVKYVDTFFAMKRTAVGAMRVAAKLFLNSLYGKFFQKVPLGDVGWYDLTDDAGGIESYEYVERNTQGDFDYQIGGLYHPPIAALITGFVRAKIHRLEHRYGAVMTSTDGFFAIRPPEPGDIGADLGMLTVERGDLSIWRERLYDFRPRRGRSYGLRRRLTPSSKDPSKYALHGFRGTIAELRRIPLVRNLYHYQATQVITNHMATRAYRKLRYAPGTFAEMTFTLDLTESQAPP